MLLLLRRSTDAVTSLSWRLPKSLNLITDRVVFKKWCQRSHPGRTTMSRARSWPVFPYDVRGLHFLIRLHLVSLNETTTSDTWVGRSNFFPSASASNSALVPRHLSLRYWCRDWYSFEEYDALLSRSLMISPARSELRWDMKMSDLISRQTRADRLHLFFEIDDEVMSISILSISEFLISERNEN